LNRAGRLIVNGARDGEVADTVGHGARSPSGNASKAVRPVMQVGAASVDRPRGRKHRFRHFAYDRSRTGERGWRR